MADEGFDALARDTTSIPDAGVDDIVASLNAEERPRDETGKFKPREEAAGADDGDAVEESEAAAVEAEAEDDAAPDEDRTSGEDEGEAESEDAPTIVLPESWPADKAELFAKLDPDAQEFLRQQDSETNKTVKARLAEAAADRKATQAEREAAQAERQHSAQFLTQVAAYARTMDPIIAQGMNTDWAKLAREEGADEAYARQQEFNQRVQHLQQVEAELHRIQTGTVKQRKETEERQLREKLPEVADTAKLQSLKDHASPILAEVGYSPQEIEQYWEYMPDHRQALVIQRLVKLERQEAERKAIAAKKAVSTPPKVQRPKAQQDAQAREGARATALRKQLDKDPGNIDVLTDLVRTSIGARQ